VDATIEPKFDWQHHNIEFNGKLSTSNDFSAGFAAKDLFTKGTKIELSGAQTEKDGVSAKLVGAYKSEPVSAKINVGYPVAKKPVKPIKINGELVLQYP